MLLVTGSLTQTTDQNHWDWDPGICIFRLPESLSSLRAPSCWWSMPLMRHTSFCYSVLSELIPKKREQKKINSFTFSTLHDTLSEHKNTGLSWRKSSLSDLVEDSDVFIWGKATLNHFFESFYCHWFLKPLLEDGMFVVSNYEWSRSCFKQTLPLSVILQRSITMIRIIVLKSADLAINHSLEQHFGRHWSLVVKSLYFGGRQSLVESRPISSWTQGNSFVIFFSKC